ncbi:diguanylate cyclase [Hoeflea sp. AS60]|uniref:diguanylate cyclase domain-containing protein n=1 Tax=Hoeflea sp. AS60 TaxID=3135780 RepID=UPI003172FD4D
MAHAGYEFLTSPFGMAAVAAPLGITALVARLGHRHDRLARQIRSERAATEQLRQAAYHDNLTGLRNRHALSEDVERIIRCKTRQSAPMALLLFDLDRFKYINDTMGHAAGDLVLKQLAERLQAYCKPGQRVYRLGGDEFVLLWESAPGTKTISSFCDGLAAFVFRPIESLGVMIDTAGSIGFAVTDENVTALSDLLKRADLALYHAKEMQGSSHSFFTDEMDRDHRQRQQLAADMRAGIAGGAFHIDYLPVVKASTMSVSGFTVRLRWIQSEADDLSEGELMAMAEASGLMLPLGHWMLERALKDASGWLEKAEITLPVAAVQLRDQAFAGSVIAALDKSGLEPERLVLDVDPHASRHEGAIVLGNLERLREKGVKISVSELAASIAGLSMARSFPVDRVRLDLASIRSIAGEKRLLQMLTLFLQLASTVDTPVTLTGVDSSEDLECACDAGAEQVQGAIAATRLCALQASRFPMSMDDPEFIDTAEKPAPAKSGQLKFA